VMLRPDVLLGHYDMGSTIPSTIAKRREVD
jgi:hypothetical protein